MATRNVTLSVPEDLLRQAKGLAAQRDTSVSALVSDLLTQLVGAGHDYDEMWAEEEATMARGSGMRLGDIDWTREDVHTR